MPLALLFYQLQVRSFPLWLFFFTSCGSALLLPAVGLALLRFPSTIRLVDLVLKLRVLVASRDFALRAVSRVLLRTLLTCCFSARTFTCCAWRSLAPELGCCGSHVHVAILLWPAFARGLSVGVTVAPEFVCLWFLALTTSSFPGKRTVKVNGRASHVPLRLPGRPLF